jgi:hypothetical protein
VERAGRQASALPNRHGTPPSLLASPHRYSRPLKPSLALFLAAGTSDTLRPFRAITALATGAQVLTPPVRVQAWHVLGASFVVTPVMRTVMG